MKRLGLLLTLVACSDTSSEWESAARPREEIAGPYFETIDLAASVPGVAHTAGISGEFYFPEIMGSGGAMLDYDGDGDLDLYLVQGGAKQSWRGSGEEAGRDSLLRNDGTAHGRDWFVDVTERALIPPMSFGMGVATGDLDRDGHVDIYRTSWGRNRLLRNRGDGSFDDWSAGTGPWDDSWSTSATIVDLDGDGWLDIYVANYVDFRVEAHVACQLASGYPEYCGPQVFRPAADRLLINLGVGEGGRVRLADVSAEVGLLDLTRPALGVISVDIDDDGVPELYVANDQEHNTLWKRLDSGRLVDLALVSGVAVNAEGGSEASMGIDAADLDGDGVEDLFASHLRTETNTLYAHRSEGAFEDRTHQVGLALPSVAMTGFGTAFLDLENDGDLDLVVVNGTVRAQEEVAAPPGDRRRYSQRNQLFVHADGTYREEAPLDAGGGFEGLAVSRGLAAGDLDNDGDLDLLITNSNGPPDLLRNRDRSDRWLGLSLHEETGGESLGAQVQVRAADAFVRVSRVRTDGSYCSARDPRVLVGLGETAGPLTARVRWPDGRVVSMRDLRPGRYVRIPR